MQSDVRREILKGLKRVVIKIGSIIIANRETGQASLVNGLNANNVRHVAETIRPVVDRDCEVVLVSFGAMNTTRGILW